MKSLAIIGVYNKWVYLYSGVSVSHEVLVTDINKPLPVRVVIDKHILNESLYSEILFESLPQIVLQVVNNVYLGTSWTFVSYISVVVSGINILNGIYRVAYYKYYLKINLVDIPGTNYTHMYISLLYY